MGGRSGLSVVAVLGLAILSDSCNAEGVAEDSLVVQTSHGQVKGHKFTSPWTNQLVYAFQGIPYAAPPLGELRFKDPVVPDKWTSVKDCTEDGDSCMQTIDPILNMLNLTFKMSEDCLYLNVYTPKLKPASLLPVMVWVHGGAFIEGSGSRSRYGPDVLVAEGVIVVTLNYRLGALGFLALGTQSIAGNAGLKDQRLALQWVQREISQFGGDPGNVTLFGGSAGSASVHLQYISPLSKGLFHRVIGESGTSLAWAVKKNGTVYGLKMASALSCSTENLSATEKCLREASAEDIVKAQPLIKDVHQDDAIDSLNLVFTPTVDTASTEPFLPDVPKAMIKQKLGSFVPFVMGVNAQEGIMMLYLGDGAINNITNNLERFIPREVKEVITPARKKFLSERIKSFYFKNPVSLPDKINGFIHLYTDAMFGYHTAVSVREFTNRSPVYVYRFEFNGLFKEVPFRMVEAKYNITGVGHAEELNYLFVRRKVNQTSVSDSREMNTWKRMARMWTNFAKFGTPTVGADPLLQNVTWIPVGKVSTRYLRIDDNLTMTTEDFLGPCVSLWDNMTPSSGILSLHLAGTVGLVAAAAYVSERVLLS